MTRIAIVGAGFCGMAAAWNFLQYPGMEVVVFDSEEIGNSTSGIAAGLLHPYVGAHSKLNWQAMEGMRETYQLLQVAQQALNAPVFAVQGMLRLATTPQQTADFLTCAHTFSDVHSRNAQQCHVDIPCINPYPGIFIDSAITVYCSAYLKGLWKACLFLGAQFEQTKVSSLKELDHFDHIVMATGAQTVLLKELSHLRISCTKGQILELAWPQHLNPLPYPINSQSYLVMHPSKHTCFLGATYEKQFTTTTPDAAVAMREIFAKTRPLLPQIDEWELIGCKAGVRAGLPDRKPLIAQVNDKCWVLTGMGSKGLLYHALFANTLVSKVLFAGK